MQVQMISDVVKLVKAEKRSLIIRTQTMKGEYLHVFSMPSRVSYTRIAPMRAGGLAVFFASLAIFILGFLLLSTPYIPQEYNLYVLVGLIAVLGVGTIGLLLATKTETRLEIETIGGLVYAFNRMDVLPEKIEEEIQKLL